MLDGADETLADAAGAGLKSLAAIELHLAETTDRHPLQPISYTSPKEPKAQLTGLAVLGYRVYSRSVGIESSRRDWSYRGFPFRIQSGMAPN